MQYTKVKQADSKIASDMETICQEIKKQIPSVISVILTGGFSRGEGPVKKINGKFIPYNDYDIQVITREKISKKRTDFIAGDISKKLGYGSITNIFYPFKKENQKLQQSFYIDLKCDTPTDLKKLLPRIRTYELKNDSKILFGKDIRYLIPNYSLKKIPLSESAKLLLDRTSQMIEYYSTEKNYDKEVLTYFIQQAYAACCTALLQISGKYQIGYSKSANILDKTFKKDFPELYNKIPNLHKKINQFIKWKTNPKKLPNQDVEKEWFIARKNILEVLKYFFSKFLNKKIENLDELSKAIGGMQKEFYSPYIKAIIKNKTNSNFLANLLTPSAFIFLAYDLRRRYNKRLKELEINKVVRQKSPDLVIFSSGVYILGAITEKGIEKNSLAKARKSLEKVYPVKAQNWEDLTLDYANAYIAFFLQKI